MSFLPGFFTGGFFMAAAAVFALLAFFAVEHENAKKAETTKSSLIVRFFKMCWF